jgi:Flp pilus assembly CpaE family ATPase
LDSGVGQHRLHVLLNRTPKRTEVTLEELDRMLGVPIYATLPNDYPALYEAYSEGNLLPANSILGKNFARVAAKIAGIQQKDKKKRAFSFMS